MIGLSAFSISTPITLLAALLLCFVCIAAAIIRRPALPYSSLWLFGIGLIFLTLAAGGPVWNRAAPGEVIVMVDLSPSTRGAQYRSRSMLEARVRQLLGRTPYRIECFGDATSQPLSNVEMLADVLTDRTVFQPRADATAVVLFSDGQFQLPAIAPPTFVVLDPALETPVDARVKALELRGREVAATVSNVGVPRPLAFSGVPARSTTQVAQGSFVLTHDLEESTSQVSAQFAPADQWPENDQLSIVMPPQQVGQRWWIGRTDPGPGWRQIDARQFPTEPAALLAPAVIVLQNVASSDLNDLQQQWLAKYVRDLGGSLIILGGDRAFAAGAYSGTVLESLSPLASTPPVPTTHWMLLADGSGSMAAADAGISRWQAATDAMAKLVPFLPPDDLVSIGSFADHLNWWSAGKTARQTMDLKLPPPTAFPHGPTNLEPALNELAGASDGTIPRQLLLLTDADVSIDDPAGLTLALKQKKIRVHLLAVGNGSGLSALTIIAGGTGGTVIQQFDPKQWAMAARQLMQAAHPKLLERDPIAVHFLAEIASQEFSVERWNRTWPKSSAVGIAAGKLEEQSITMGAKWNSGQGQVAALAFDAPPAVITPLAATLARQPADPRYRVSWETGPRLRVRVMAIDGQKYLNGENIRLEMMNSSDDATHRTQYSIPQNAPGEYELALDSPRHPAFATVTSDRRVLDRIALAGRYAPEFDAIGNNRETLNRLARQSGGQVILPDQKSPISFRFPTRAVTLTSLMAILGAIAIGSGIGRWQAG